MLKSGLILLLVCITGISCCTPVVLKTDLGHIVGTSVTIWGVQVHQFLGIPYAKPPTADLRFKKPVPVDAWSEPIVAAKQPPACVQYTENPFPWYDNGTGKSEDCLYLNIWTPANTGPNNKKAVLYWIFGGGFFVGSIRQPIYSGDTLAAVGDIIVVTVSYRLGSLGFLYSGTEDAPGNVGLWDILAGLQWVNDHISAFGGDVSRITIAGGSAGSIAVGLLSVSPRAENLYARQIMQSGSPAYTMADNNTASLDRSQRIAERVNCANHTFRLKNHPGTVVECLRGVDPMDLIRAEFSLNPQSSRSFLPRWGDEILPELPRQKIIDGRMWKKDLLIGNSKDEGSFQKMVRNYKSKTDRGKVDGSVMKRAVEQITTRYPDIFGFYGEKYPNINRSMGRVLLRDIFAAYPNTESVVRYFLPDTIAEDDFDYVRSQVYTASGDFSLLCPTVYYAEKSAQSGNHVMFYMWSHRSSTLEWKPWMGVVHYSEIEYLFGLPVKHPENYVGKYDMQPQIEHRISLDIMHKWSSFVKFGIPYPFEQWPLYSKDAPLFARLDSDDYFDDPIAHGPHKENCDFFRSHFGF